MKVVLTENGDPQRGGMWLNDVADGARAILITEQDEYIATGDTTKGPWGVVQVFRKVIGTTHVRTDQDDQRGKNVTGNPRPDSEACRRITRSSPA